jgi:hypothetical protein
VSAIQWRSDTPPPSGLAKPPPTRKLRVMEKEIFVAYPYHFNAQGYREMLDRLQAEYAIKFRYADDTPSATHLTEKIRGLILQCSVSVLDLSDWNANVAYEFGIFIGARLPMHRAWLFLNSTLSENVPSDVQGFAQNRYTSMAELETVFRRALRGIPKRAEVEVFPPFIRGHGPR